MEEEKKRNIYRLLSIAILGIFALFMAFYFAMELILHKITSPEYTIKHVERIIKSQEREMRKAEKLLLTENPFEPKMRPMLVNLIKENQEYKAIVDLKPFDGNNEGIDVAVDKKTLTISGKFDKRILDSEKIINFSQSYYLDEDLLVDKITKEKKGDKYIITIPFED